MCHDAPEQPGTWRYTADANVVRAGLAILMMMTVLEGPARAQSGTEPVVTIPVHSGTSTIFFLPDDVERIRLTADVAGLVAATFYDNKVIVRPLRKLPVGDEVTLAIKTATIKQRFQLRMVRHRRDAAERVVVAPAASAELAAEPAASAPIDVPSVASPAAHAPSDVPSPIAPPARAPITLPSLVPPAAPAPASLPGAGTPAPAPVADAQGNRAAVARAPRFDVSVHALAALGTTELTLAGYEPVNARQTHHALGVRLTGAPHGAWWAMEVEVSGERLLGPTMHAREARGDVLQRDVVEMSGALLRAEAGLRAWLAAPWSPTVNARIGLLVHHRDIEHTTKNISDNPIMQYDGLTRDMPFGGVLSLGVGLQYRARNMLLGLDFQVRQGVPADYRSIEAVLSVGCFLNQAE